MKPKHLRMASILAFLTLLATTVMVAALPEPSFAGQKKLRIGHQVYPIHEQQLKWMKKWGEMNGVAIESVPISYGVFVEKLSASLMANSKEYDIIWHNDDWGPLWGAFLEPLDDIKTIPSMNREILIDKAMLWPGPDGKPRITAIPLVETLGIMFYRKDLISPKEYPRTWADVVRVSRRLQKEGKVKWGLTGGMKYPNTYNTILWSMWSNDSDIFSPPDERDEAVLKKNGWKTMLPSKSFREMVEFWWDNIHTHKISPPGQVSYTGPEADAVFMAGDAFLTQNDTTLLGKYNDPKASKVAGKVAFGPFPTGPSNKKGQFAWRAAWFWAIPKAIDPEQKKLAKQLLTWLTESEEVQRDIWTSVGGIPPVVKVQEAIAASDPLFKELKAAVIDVPHSVVPGYYVKQWPKINATISDVVTKALSGKREDIGKVLDEGDKKITAIMTE